MAPMFCSFVKGALTLFKYVYKISFSLDVLWFSLNSVKNRVNWEPRRLIIWLNKK